MDLHLIVETLAKESIAGAPLIVDSKKIKKVAESLGVKKIHWKTFSPFLINEEKKIYDLTNVLSQQSQEKEEEQETPKPKKKAPSLTSLDEEMEDRQEDLFLVNMEENKEPCYVVQQITWEGEPAQLIGVTTRWDTAWDDLKKKAIGHDHGEVNDKEGAYALIKKRGWVLVKSSQCTLRALIIRTVLS